MIFALSAYAGAETTPDLQKVTARLSAEADRFDQSAHRVLGLETLRQTLPKGSRISRSRRGFDVVLPEQIRTVVSEYGFIAVDERGGWLKEARMVLTVDGLKWKKGKSGIDSLAKTLSATDDKKKRSLLEGYEAFGLQGFVTDLGQIILLFARGLIANYEFTYEGTDSSDPERPLIVYRYSQISGTDSVTVYEKVEPVRLRLEGKIWVRPGDYLPVRVSVDTNRMEGEEQIRDLSVVDYENSRWGFLLPRSIKHEQFVANSLFVRDEFAYTNFRQVLTGGR